MDRPPGHPSLDELASDWIPTRDAEHFPAVHNFHETLLLTEDLFRVNFWPGAAMYCAWNPEFQYRTLDDARLTVDRKTVLSDAHQFCAWEGRRRAQRGNLHVETATRMAFEAKGILRRVTLRHAGDSPSRHLVGLSLPGEWKAHGSDMVTCTAPANGHPAALSHAVRMPGMKAVYDAAIRRSMLSATLDLRPGETRTFDVVLFDAADAATARQSALGCLGDFDQVFAQARENWEARWAAVFDGTPGHFSGRLPVLETDDASLRRIWYMSILTVVLLFRTNLKLGPRFFVTSGEREPGRIFFWDVSECGMLVSLLEPAGTKEILRHFLRCDPHGGCTFNANTGVQNGQWYGANDFSLFRLVHAYVSATNDEAFLDERVGDRTVLQHLEHLATNWKGLVHEDHPWLGDYGDVENLLECVPTYLHRVPSFNAANVWMQRVVADLLARRGDVSRAARLREDAERVKAAVLGLYVHDEGVWACMHRDGRRVVQRHCYDFALVGFCLHGDLEPAMRSEMIGFVHRELLTRTWMRAQSLADVGAAQSDRPDHGPYGAFAAWPAVTAEALFLLGDPGALDFLRRTAEVTREGPYGQAHELVGAGSAGFEATARVTNRVGCMRECGCGGAFAEVVLRCVFGFSPGPGKAGELLAPARNRGVLGVLRGLVRTGKTLGIECDPRGVRWFPQPTDPPPRQGAP